MIQIIQNEESIKMKKMSKKQKFIHSLQQNATLFSCPICKEDMYIDKDINFTCLNHHSYNIAKQGYIHFLHKSVPSSYDKGLFQARQFILSRTALYQSVTDKIVQFIRQFTKVKSPIIVDMGCGEGSHLANVCQNLSSTSVGIGFDISKEAIMAATHYNDTILTSVADIADVPLQAAQTDVVLNVLSPSNYKEFNRITHGDSIIIKVIPSENYLREIREQLFSEQEEQQTYSNEAVVNRFRDTYNIIAEKHIHHKYKVDDTTLQNLINMTPLTWNASNSAYEQLISANIKEITMDVTILVGKKK